MAVAPVAGLPAAPVRRAGANGMCVIVERTIRATILSDHGRRSDWDVNAGALVK
jgi:hypothetical protein